MAFDLDDPVTRRMLEAHIVAAQGIEEELAAAVTQETIEDLLRQLFHYLNRLQHKEQIRVFDDLKIKTLKIICDFHFRRFHDSNSITSTNSSYWRWTVKRLHAHGYKFECKVVRDHNVSVWDAEIRGERTIYSCYTDDEDEA